MALQSCQKQDIANLLASSNSLINPNQNCLAAAQYLSHLGFIKLKISYFIICAKEEDHLDWPYVIDPNCNNEIFIDPDFNEECDDIICEDCGRYILPNTHQKQRFHLLTTQLNPERIINWFEGQLINSNLLWHKADMGVYHIIAYNKLINLIIPDFCTDATYLTIDKLRVQPTVLMSLRKDISNLPLTLSVIPMVDLLYQHKILNEILLTTIEKGVPELIPNISRQVLPSSYISLKQVTLVQEKTLQLQIKKGVIYINNVEIINKKAASCFNIFQILLEQFLSDFAMGVAPEQHTLLSINKLEKRLISLEITDLEQQIRKPLNKMQRTIKEKLASKLGLNIERNDVIQTLGWPGSTCKEYGYRLNPFTLILKKKIDAISAVKKSLFLCCGLI